MGMKCNLLAAIAVVCLLTACNGQQKKEEKSADEKPILTVTVEPQRYFTEAIAGDKFTVVSMVPKGASPETYDPAPQQLVTLSKSKAYLRIGFIGFEQIWMERLMENTPHMQVFDTSAGIDLILGHSHGKEVKDGHPHNVEPHIWNSTHNAKVIARNICRALCQLDKENRPYYTARLDSLCLRIQQTDSLIRQKLQAKEADKAFMIYHPALSYFARDYGLTQIAIEEDGKEPSPAQLKKLIDICKEQNVHVIFVQPEFDRRNAEAIAAQTGTHVVDINPLSYQWEEEMIHAAEALTQYGSAGNE